MRRALFPLVLVLLALAAALAAPSARAAAPDFDAILKALIPDKDPGKLAVGESTLATVSDPAPLLRFGAKGIKAGDQVKLTRKPDDKWLIEPAPAKEKAPRKRPK